MVVGTKYPHQLNLGGGLEQLDYVSIYIYIGNFIIPTDYFFQRCRLKPPTSFHIHTVIPVYIFGCGWWVVKLITLMWDVGGFMQGFPWNWMKTCPYESRHIAHGRAAHIDSNGWAYVEILKSAREDAKRWWIGDGSKPWYLVNPKIAGKWMFIPLKMVLIGIDPYPIHYWQGIKTMIKTMIKPWVKTHGFSIHFKRAASVSPSSGQTAGHSALRSDWIWTGRRFLKKSSWNRKKILEFDMNLRWILGLR